MKKTMKIHFVLIALLTASGIAFSATETTEKKPVEKKTTIEKKATETTTVEKSAPKTEKMSKLVLKLPAPLFEGTPKKTSTKHLERKPAVVEVFIPAGVTNVALNKKVTGSDDYPVIGELDLITDGDKDGSDGTFVELGSKVQWVQIDLGAPKTIYAIAVWHYHAQARIFFDVVVQVADDAAFTKNVRTLFNNDYDNSVGQGVGKDKEYIDTYKGRLINAKKTKAQFVRLYSAGSTGSEMNHYVEVEVFGE